MKKFFILCSMAAAMFSCSKFTQEHDGQTVELGGREEVTVTFDFEGLDNFATKSTATGSEKVMKSVEIFAFYSGKLVAHYPRTERSETSPAPSLTVMPGNHTFYAIVNQPSVGKDDITTEDSLKSKVFTFNEKSSDLPMYGESTINITTGQTPVKITLKRNIAKIVVEKITASLSGLYDSYPVTLTKVYFLNVNEKYSLYNLSSTPSDSWKNPYGQTVSTSNNYYYHGFTDVSLISSSSTKNTHALNQNFYICPNNSSATKTMLCVSFTLLGEPYSLVHTFESISANTVYDIKEIKLMGTGREVKVSMTLDVANWDDVTVGTSGVIELGKLK